MLINLDLFDTYTVLVLGAGASAHLGYPVGSQFSDNILESTRDPAAPSFIQLHEMGFSHDLILNFRQVFSASGALAIDAFLEKRQEFIEVGRAAIACELVKYEDETPLSVRTGNWYFQLSEQLRREIDRNDVGFVVVTFNYDRSLDKFLHDFLWNTYPQRTQSLEHYVPILHVHGCLGYLEHQTGREPRRPYKPTASSDDILAFSKGIQVPVELANKLSPEMVDARDAIRGAKKVVFLGFGYDSTNLRRLGIDFPLAGQRWIGENKYFGTAYQLPKGRIEELSTASEGRLILGDSGTPIYDYLLRENCWKNRS
jgi:hypothetical protein